MSIAQKIEHTLLKAQSKESDIEKLCEEALEHHIYAVCVPPIWSEVAAKALAHSKTKVVSVVGFPFGFSTKRSKSEEAKELIERAVNEVDMVINISAVIESHEKQVVEEIESVMKQIGSCPLKVIIECPLLSPAEISRAASYVSKAGAAFVKTGTGLHPNGARPQDIQIIRKEVGSLMGIKASGGIKTYAQALELIDAGATRIGCSASLEIIKQENEANEKKEND